MQHDPFCWHSELLAHQVMLWMRCSLSGQSASFPWEAPARQLDRFPGGKKKKGEPQFLTFCISVVGKRLLGEERSAAPCSAALAVVQHKVPAQYQLELRAPRR